MSDTNDAWSTDTPSTGYSPTKFYTASTNKKGFSKSARWPVISFNPEVLSELGALIATGKFPEYRTQADFFRDAVVHMLALRKDQFNDDEFSKRIDRFLKLAEIERLRQVGEVEREIVDTITEMLAHERDPMKRLFIVAEATEAMDYLESEYYRAELRTVIEKHAVK